MKKTIFLILIISSLVPLASEAQENILERYYRITEHQFFGETNRPNLDKIKYHCLNNSLIPKKDNERNIIGLIKNPGNIIFKTSNKSAKFIDYTFSNNCRFVYALVDYNQGNVDLYRYNTKTGNYVKITSQLAIPPIINYQDGWDVNPMAKPYPVFIYPLAGNKLLISSQNFTTGFDEYTNFLDHKIFYIENNKFKKINLASKDKNREGELNLNSVDVLDIKKNTLIHLENHRNGENITEILRSSYDLNHEKITKKIIKPIEKSETTIVINNCLINDSDNEPTSPEHLACLNNIKALLQ